MDGRLHNNQLIDRITYLASLVSEPRSVDTTLDKLRIITATSSELSAQDIKTLGSIETQLEEYLVHRERLRSFTKASLRDTVERHFAAGNPVRTGRRAALRQIIVTIAAAGGVTGILTALGAMKGQVILAFFVCALFIGLALIFQSFKKDLVAQLQGSLNYIMAATVGTGLFALNFPIIAANNYLNNLPMLQHGGFLVGAVPVYAFYYVGFYRYAKQLRVSVPPALRPWGVLVTAILLAFFCVVIPHPVAVSHEGFFDLAVAGFAVSVYLSAAAAVLGFMTVPKTTAVYSRSTLFLAISMMLQTLGNGYFVIFVTFISGDFSVNEQKGQILSALLIVAALASQYIAAYKSKTSLQ